MKFHETGVLEVVHCSQIKHDVLYEKEGHNKKRPLFL